LIKDPTARPAFQSRHSVRLSQRRLKYQQRSSGKRRSRTSRRNLCRVTEPKFPFRLAAGPLLRAWRAGLLCASFFAPELKKINNRDVIGKTGPGAVAPATFNGELKFCFTQMELNGGTKNNNVQPKGRVRSPNNPGRNPAQTMQEYKPRKAWTMESGSVCGVLVKSSPPPDRATTRLWTNRQNRNSLGRAIADG